jgi:hypothetical protein
LPDGTTQGRQANAYRDDRNEAVIFISYRRSDSGGHAGRLFDRLRQWFDDDALFYDQDGIDIGETFPASIEAAIDKATVVLVLIGPD